MNGAEEVGAEEKYESGTSVARNKGSHDRVGSRS